MADKVKLRKLLALQMSIMVRHRLPPLFKVVDEVVKTLRGSKVYREIIGPTAAAHSDDVKRYLVKVIFQILENLEVECG